MIARALMATYSVESKASEVYGGLKAFMKTSKQLTGHDEELQGRLGPHITEIRPMECIVASYGRNEPVCIDLNVFLKLKIDCTT
jgi:hypothetical protein